jgi:hypothetical protein
MFLRRRTALIAALLIVLVALPVAYYTVSYWPVVLAVAAVALLLYSSWNFTPPPAPLSPSHQLKSQSLTMREMEQRQCALSEAPAPPEGVVFRGAIGALYPAAYKPRCYSHNAYATPGVYDYDQAVRSAAQVCTVPKEDNHYARMYNPVNQIPEDLIMHPLPDPTLQARQPMFEDSLLCDRGFLAATDTMRINPQGLGRRF